jgi:3',5'-cyclic AMP phosphodiesterase CpdA
VSLFRILHASDLHFASIPHQIGIPDLLAAWSRSVPGTWAATSSQGTIYVDAFAAFAHANRAGFDVLVLSGDLATTGRLKDLSTAQAFLNRDVGPGTSGYHEARGQPTLRAGGRPIVLVPGNHDRYTRFHLPGGRNFDATFRAYWGAGQGVQLRWTGQRSGATLVLLGVDFSLRRHDMGSGALGFLGRGRVYRKRLDQLHSLTRQARSQSPGCAVLWVMHFEPEARNPLLALLDERRLIAVLQDQPADAILCGHTHASTLNKTFAGVPTFVCGTTTQHASIHGNTLHVLDVEVSSSATSPRFSCRVFRYDPAVGQFT